MLYIEKKGFEGLKEVPKLPYDDDNPFNHPFIAKGNSYSKTHPQNNKSRLKFYNYRKKYDIMDTVLDKYDPFYYEIIMRTSKKEEDISYIDPEKYIDTAEEIAKDDSFTNSKDTIFDRGKFRIFHEKYFEKFDNIISTAYFLNENILNSEAQKEKADIREALDSQDKPRGRKALWDLIGLYGRYINNNCRSCRYYNTYASELDDSKSKATNENPANICSRWEYNPVGCNHECSTGKILSKIEGALYDLYSMFDFPDDNGALR